MFQNSSFRKGKSRISIIHILQMGPSRRHKLDKHSMHFHNKKWSCSDFSPHTLLTDRAPLASSSEAWLKARCTFPQISMLWHTLSGKLWTLSLPSPAQQHSETLVPRDVVMFHKGPHCVSNSYSARGSFYMLCMCFLIFRTWLIPFKLLCKPTNGGQEWWVGWLEVKEGVLSLDGRTLSRMP